MTIATKFDMATLTGRLAVHYARDRLLRPGARIGEAPRSPEALTTEWLTSALCAHTPDAAVTGFGMGGHTAGTSARATLTVAYNEAGIAAGLPPDLFLKSTPTMTTRLVGGMSNLATCEASFYNHIRPELEIEAPIGYHAVADERTGRSLIILEDVSRTRGATFATPLSRYTDKSRAEGIVDVLAAYHGRYWNRPDRLSALTWLPDGRTFFLHLHSMMNIRKLAERGIGRAEGVLAPEFLARRDDVWPSFLKSLDHLVRGPQTMLHQDVHAGNWYVTGDERMGLYDWQCMGTGSGTLDLGYALMSALTIEDRRAWERELVCRYLDRIGEAGATPPTFEDAWLSYRQQLFHGLFMWLPTIGAGPLQPTMQPTDVSLANLERMAQAVVDHDSFGSVDG